MDLVVTDVQMPRMNGLELTRQVKSRFGLPVLLVTGMEKEEHRREGLAAGADAYVVKSTFQGEGLLDIVKPPGIHLIFGGTSLASLCSSARSAAKEAGA